MTSGPGSEVMSLMDIPASGAAYIASGVTGAAQAITMIPSTISGGLYGYSMGVADLITGKTPYEGYHNRWGNTMNSLMQPWYRADKGGNAVMEGAFMPITAAMHGVEWVGDGIINQGWDKTGRWTKVLGNVGVVFVSGKLIYHPIGKGFKTALYNNPKVSGKGSFEAGTIDFINTLNDFKAFHYLADKTKTGIKSKITYPLMKQQWVRDIGLKFGYDFKKNFQLTEAAPWHYHKNYNVKKEKVLKLKLFPDFEIDFGFGPRVKTVTETVKYRHGQKVPGSGDKKVSKTKYKYGIRKSFKFKVYELYTFKDKGIFHFRDQVLPELIGDLGTLNFKEFNGKHAKTIKKYNISQGDIIKWSKHVYNTKQFGLKKNWKNYYQQKRLSETDPAKFSEIYEGKSNLGEPITADIISDKTITSVRRTNNPKNKKETILEIKNPQKNINKQVIYPDAKSANIALSDLNTTIASYAELYKNEMYHAHAEVLTDFLANKDSKDLSFRYNRSILEPNANMDKISVKSVEIPDQTTTAVLDAVSDIMKENFEIFKRNPNNSNVTVSRTPKGTKISVELLSAKENRQLNLDFGRKNNSTVTNSDEGVLVKSDDTNMHTFERTDKILNIAQDVIKGNPLEIPEPTLFSKASNFKVDLSHQIDYLFEEQQKLQMSIKDFKNPDDIKMLENKIKNIDSVLKTLYSNLDAIDNAIASGQVPIERLYHGSRITRQITEKDFDINKNKIDPYIEEGSPITLANKIDPELWPQLMKNKEYMASRWLVATKLLDAYIKKNPGKLVSPDSEYLMFRRLDTDVMSVPEFYNIKDGKFYSPSHDVAKAYSRKPKGITSIDVPEIDAKYSLAAPKVKPKAPVAKKKAAPKKAVAKKPEKIAKTVDIKKGRIRALTAKEINELTPQAQKKYLRDKEQELYDVAKKRLKLTDADMDKLGTDWLQKLNARERAVQKAIKAQLVKVEGIIKARKEANDLFTWYRPGTENRNISQKKPVDMPVEIKERLNELAPLEQKIASTKKQLETVKNNTDEYYILENQLKQAQKEHSEYHKENLKEVSVSLENTVKELRNDLRAVQKKQLTLSKEQIKKHKDTIVAAENLRGRINKAIADKLSLDEFRETKSNIIPGLTKLLKFIDLKKQLARIRKTAPTYTPEQIDFIVNEKYVSIPNEEHIVTNPELFARNSQYKKALDTVYKIEAKLDKEYKFGNKINKEVPKFIDSWDIITHIENRILPKNQRVGNRLIDGDTPQALAKRINDNPKIKRIIKEYQTRIENVRKDINKELLLLGKEEYIQFLENYIPHMWDIKGQKSLDFVKKWTKSTPNVQKRKIPTYAEGIKMGLKPKLDNLGEIYQKYVHANYVMVRNNKLLHQLKNARDVNGNSIIFTNNGLSSARERVLKEVDYAKKNNFPEEYIERLQNEADGFDIKNYDKFEQEYVMRVFGKMKDGTLIAGKDPVYIHKDYAPVIKPFVENAYILPRKVGQLYSGVNNLFKQAFFLVSFFHPIALTESAVAALGFGGQGVGKFNPGRGFALLFEQNPVTGKRKIIQRPHKIGRQLIETEVYDDFIRHGGTRDNSSIDYHHSSLTGMMDKMLRYRQSKNGLQKAVLAPIESLRIPKWLLEKNNKMLWEHYHQGLKVFTWNDVVGKITREFPEVDQYMLKSLVAEFVNDAFGGQNNYKLPISKMNKIWNDPNYRRRLGHILLAPDWTLSVQQQFYKALRRGDAVKQFYGNDRLVNPILNKTYRRYWAMNFALVVGQVEFLNWLLHQATGDDEYTLFEDGVLNIDMSRMMIGIYKSGALELVGIDKEKTDRWIKQHENRPLVAGFGKQFKEVLNPYFSVLEAVIGLGYGNNIKHELADFTEEERKIFSNKVAPGISLMHELATGTTVGGFKLPESHLDDKFSREWWEYKLGHVKEKLIPISLKGTNFALSLPLGQKLSLYKGRQEIDRLLTIYAEGDAQFDIMNKFKKGFFKNISYPDYVSNLKDLMPELLKEIQKNNPKTNVMKLFEERVAAKRSHYMGRFMQEFNPMKEGKERPWSSIRIGRLNRYALNMARLHKSGKMLHGSLKNYGFDPYYEDPAYQEYMDFADSLINNMPYGDGTIPTKFGNRVEYDIWKGTIQSNNYKKKIVLELDEE